MAYSINLNDGGNMKKLRFLITLIVCILGPSLVFADVVPKLIGTWGYADVIHNNDGTWHSETGTLIFNNNGTGTVNAKYNDAGLLNTVTKSFTYSAASNPDGSITLTFLSGSSGTRKFILSDDGKMFVADSTGDTNRQTMHIAVKIDPLKAYSTSDLNGGYYSISYEHDSSGGNFGSAHYIAYSHADTFNGAGALQSDISYNADGSIGTLYGVPFNYLVGSDGSLQISFGYIGYGTGDGKIGVGAAPTISTTWQLHNNLKKGDKTYSTSDLAGTWVLTSFADEGGTSFSTLIATMTCNSSGSCVIADKYQKDGIVRYDNVETINFSVSPDGSFGGSLSSISPSYAGVISDNGDAMILNMSFNQADPSSREIYSGVKCNSCSNIAGRQIPMLALVYLSPMHYGMYNYIYDPLTATINTIKENNNPSWLTSVSQDQTFALYVDGPRNGPDPIYLYNTSSKSISVVNGISTIWSAYLDRNSKILFLDYNDAAIKRIDTNGANLTLLANPVSPYTFNNFWLSPDRNLIAAIEEKSGSDYLLQTMAGS
jgi:hypothetical protein